MSSNKPNKNQFKPSDYPSFDLPDNVLQYIESDEFQQQLAEHPEYEQQLNDLQVETNGSLDGLRKKFGPIYVAPHYYDISWAQWFGGLHKKRGGSTFGGSEAKGYAQEEMKLIDRLGGSEHDTACAETREAAEDVLRRQNPREPLLKTRVAKSTKFENLVCVRNIPVDKQMSAKVIPEDQHVEDRAESVQKKLGGKEVMAENLSAPEILRMDHALKLVFKMYLQPSFFAGILPENQKTEMENVFNEMIKYAHELSYKVKDGNIVITPRYTGRHSTSGAPHIKHLKKVVVQQNGGILKVNNYDTRAFADWKTEWRHNLKRMIDLINYSGFGTDGVKRKLNPDDEEFLVKTMHIQWPKRLRDLLNLKRQFYNLEAGEQQLLNELTNALSGNPTYEAYVRSVRPPTNSNNNNGNNNSSNNNNTNSNTNNNNNNDAGGPSDPSRFLPLLVQHSKGDPDLMVKFRTAPGANIMGGATFDGTVMQNHLNTATRNRSWRPSSKSYKDLYDAKMRWRNPTSPRNNSNPNQRQSPPANPGPNFVYNSPKKKT